MKQAERATSKRHHQLRLVHSLVTVVLVLLCAEAADAGETVYEGRNAWRLYNACSKRFVVPYMQAARAIGHPQYDQCKSDFFVYPVDAEGRVRIRHGETGRYLCYNHRRRITMRLHAKRGDRQCMFIEKMEEGSHYTMLESAAFNGTFLGFNPKGVFLTPNKFQQRRRCYNFVKYQRFVSDSEADACSRSGSYLGYFKTTEKEKAVEFQTHTRNIFAKKYGNDLRAKSNYILDESSEEKKAAAAWRESLKNSLKAVSNELLSPEPELDQVNNITSQNH